MGLFLRRYYGLSGPAPKVRIIRLKLLVKALYPNGLANGTGPNRRREFWRLLFGGCAVAGWKVSIKSRVAIGNTSDFDNDGSS